MRVAAIFHPKARKWVQGRRRILPRMQSAIQGQGPVIWMHCASLGEFEQGRPLLESIRKQYPHYKILLTFFSPSGYEIRKNYSGADWVFYLPMDGARTAKRFLEIVQPSLVIFVKYEFWYYYLKKVKYRNIPIILVSALFQEKSNFFKWYGSVSRKMLSRFNQLFVQDVHSKTLLKNIGVEDITQVSGDTRFDRVVEIADVAPHNEKLAAFTKGRKLIVAGSTWEPDELILQKTFAQLSSQEFAMVIAPHEIHESHLQSIEGKFQNSCRYSTFSPLSNNAAFDCLIIDNIGLLSQLYKFAWVCHIGGGYGKGIHNTLEAAVYGKPISIGPVHTKFREALELIAVKGAYCVQNDQELLALLNSFIQDEKLYNASAEASKLYVRSRVGATEKIMNYIHTNRLLTKLSN